VFLSQNTWIKCYINDEVTPSNHSLYCLNQYLYTKPTGFITIFGYPSRYSIRYDGVCRNEGDFVLARMMFLMHSTRLNIKSDEYLRRTMIWQVSRRSLSTLMKKLAL
jgi:hypothetical protein